ncbi:ATP-dependent helicase [Sulfoacidibacillus thermotolerans]|uniref:DNA 3'-5' helicase n=1 Tax=Sulfoacidibacillus thermotolerans TaxID=1765684 RepID=A0A2U3DCN9_SULT2|nr:ATP-dependent helicase [Sulfoacidibacillus thermotolerans]PWI59053.1 hypothetical protein BM613_00100 [Sulfoacidibacillus thermotolerans]
MTESEFKALLDSRSLHLTNEQWEAIREPGPALTIYAGPGSGKTTVLTLRAAYLHLVRKIRPEQIVIFTFTRKSAKELQARLGSFLPPLKNVIAGTFHSLFLHWLMREKHINPKLWSAQEQRAAIVTVLTELRLPTHQEARDQYVQSVSKLKNLMQEFNRDNLIDTHTRQTLKVWERYEQLKRDHGRFDFDDILSEFYQTIEHDLDFRKRLQDMISVVMVDEFQDTSQIQWLSIILLCKQKIPLTVVGDDDQSIYRFRGAKPDILAAFEHSFPTTKTIVLKHNFRSTDPIIQLATEVIEQAATRKQKPFTGVVGSGIQPSLSCHQTEWAEALQVTHEIAHLVRINTHSIAVLARTHRQLICVVDALRKNRIAIQPLDPQLDLYRDYHVQRLLCVLRATQCTSDATEQDHMEARLEYGKWRQDSLKQPKLATSIDFDRFLQKMRHSTAKTAIDVARAVYDPYLWRARKNRGNDGTLERLYLLYEQASDDQSLSQWLTDIDTVIAQSQQRQVHSTQIQLLTFHAAKGLEFDHVFIIGLHAHAIPHQRAMVEAHNEYDRQQILDEERRLLYVALTRSRFRLSLHYAQTVLQQRTEVTPYLKPLLQKVSFTSSASDETDLWNHQSKFAIPTPGTVLFHKIFGRGKVISVDSMQNAGHKVCIIFNGRDRKCFYWEILQQLGHLSVSTDRGKGIRQ